MAVSQDGKWLFQNRILQPETVLTSNVAMSLPLSNLKTPQRWRVAQFSAVSNVQLLVDLGSAQFVSMVAWAGTNLSNGASVAVLRNSVNNFASATLVQDVTVVRPVTVSGGLGIDWVNFALFDPLSFRYWWIVINDGSNAAGYVRMGVLGLGQFFEYDPNFNDDIQVTWEGRGRTERTAGGTPVTDRAVDPLQLTLTYGAMTAARTWNDFLRVLRVLRGQEFWFIPFPTETGGQQYETALYGTVQSLPSVTPRTPTDWQVSRITLTESL